MTGNPIAKNVPRILALTMLLGVGGVADARPIVKTDSRRVTTPLRLDFPRLGTLRPRAAHEIRRSNWTLGCETLDRDFADFEQYKEYLEPLGIKTIRLQGGWGKCEREKGKYDFSWLDRQVDFALARGINVLLETGYGNPVYDGGGGWDLAGGFPTGAEGLAGWDAWVDALTRHFKGRVRDWAMWNEPDIGSPAKTPEQIAAFNVRTARIVKRNIPDARIAGLSLARTSPELFEQCLIAMGEDVGLFDEFIYHGYEEAPEKSYGNVEALKSILTRYAPAARMRQGENGCPSEMATQFALSGIPWSEYSQAKWDLRRMLGDLGHDVASSVFTICDFNHRGREINLKGLLRADEEKNVIAVKCAYYAVQNAVSVFDDRLTRVKAPAFGTTDITLAAYEYRWEDGAPLYLFWQFADVTRVVPRRNDKGEVVPGASGEVAGVPVRPGDSFATRPHVFRIKGGAKLEDPVFVDLLSGGVYAFPSANVCVSKTCTRLLDVPVYDSPCFITERRAVQFAPDGDAPSTGFRPLPLHGNGAWESGVTYRADRTTYELAPSDREPVDCPASHVKGHDVPRRIAFHLKGLRDVTLDFGGATVLLHGKMQPFLLENCTNVTVANVSVRYVRTPYTQGTVLSRTDRSLRVKFGPDFPVSVENGALYFLGDGWKDGPIRARPCFIQFFDPKTRAGRAIFTAFYSGPIPAAELPKDAPWAKSAPQFSPRADGDAVVLESDRPLPGSIRPGDVLVIGHAKRDHSNIELVECVDVTVRNYRIVNGLGMGVFPFHCRNVTLDGVKMYYDETSPSVIANSADGIHAFACSGDFVVRNCVVESTIDDALNVHGNYYVVEKAADREIVAFTGLEPEGPTAIFRPGDRIAVCKGHTLDRAAEYEIVAVRVLDDKHVAFTVDRPVGPHGRRDVIENLSAQCRLLISNSRFGKSNTHLRLQTRGGIVVEDCETELPLFLTGDMNYWYESSPCDALVVRNTRFIGGRAVVRSCPEFKPTEAHPSYHGDILVEDCVFDAKDALFAHGARSLTAWRCRTPGGNPVNLVAEGCPRVFNASLP